jgi:DNA-binding NarL/FixJ family response regulator
VETLPRSRSVASGGGLLAHRLQSLASSLAASWNALDVGSRADLVRQIQRVVDELSTTRPRSARTIGYTDERLRFLTARELQVLNAIADGASTSEIADRLGLRSNTVRSYVKSILSKLGVHSRLEAVTLLLNARPGDLFLVDPAPELRTS